MDMTAWLVVTIISFIGCALYLRSRIGRVTLLDTIRAYQMPSIDHLDFPEPSTRTYMVHPAVHLRSSSWCMDRLRSGLETGIDLDHDLRRAAHDPIPTSSRDFGWDRVRYDSDDHRSVSVRSVSIPLILG